MTVAFEHPSGLGPLLDKLTWGDEVAAGSVVILLGPAAHAGVGRALPSSAARLSLGNPADDGVWVATPLAAADPARGLAPLYLLGGREVVLPTIRLFVNDSDVPEYLALTHWLEDALGRWRFETADGGATTAADRVAELPPGAGLDLVAAVVRFALFGSARPVRCHGLVLPRMPMWVRPTGDGAFARNAARALVVTARLDLSGDDGALPRTTGAGAHRVSPGRTCDRGLDPFHTPEGSEIRLTARLGVGVGVTARRTLDAPEGSAALGPSSARLPFAGFNDPRRLLMAANMQVQAVPVGEPGDGIDPPGASLRVGYLAWGGWNHEDAWVLSESAAARLAATETTTVFLERRALELDEPPLVGVGRRVRRGELLIERRYTPALLTDDLTTLAALPALDEAVAVDPEAGDLAPDGGMVTAVENWDLLAPESLPTGYVVADGITARCRRVYRVTLRRELPLAVGDKLANRHGHKGVVGLILPDDRMPRWRGESLEALIDPVSVLNRSNWGQLHEAVSAGPDPGRDAAGRSEVELPGGRTTRAVAGVQFVIRLPQHASDKLAGAPARDPAGAVRRRAQRFGEMDAWAAWAHDLAVPSGGALSPAARRLADLLGGAGFRLELAAEGVAVRAWELDKEPPAAFERIPVPPAGSLADVYDRMDSGGGPRALVFEAIERPHRGPVCWLPVILAESRPPQRAADGTEEPHELTVALRALVRALRARDRDAGGPGFALRRLMDDAYAAAVGRTATGGDSRKNAWLRRGVLGGRVVPSARAVVSPAGDLGLGLDEIGLPPALAHTLFGPGLPTEDAELAGEVNGRTVWLKRDPVLHRWGLLPVRVRVAAGSTIRLTASLLGPLGADFDGDTVAVFAEVPGGGTPTEDCRAPTLAWDGDETAGRAMFVPGKQYVYGLHLLRKNPERVAALDAELPAGAKWPSGDSAKQELETWVRRAASQKLPDGAWATVERHALAALADDPGMGLGLLSLEDIRALEVVASGAVKDLYGPERAGERMAALLRGDGLSPYAAPRDLDAVDDPIAGVMVAAKTAVGRFGGALRRLLYAVPRLTPDTVRAAQTLTEQITQKALSVKAGDPPVSVGEFGAELRRLLSGEEPPPATGTALRAVLAQPRTRAVWERLRAELGVEVPAWLRWLQSPHDLAAILTETGTLTIPTDDPRAAAFLAYAEPAAKKS